MTIKCAKEKVKKLKKFNNFKIFTLSPYKCGFLAKKQYFPLIDTFTLSYKALIILINTPKRPVYRNKYRLSSSIYHKKQNCS